MEIQAVGLLGFSSMTQDMSSPSIHLGVSDLYTRKIVAGTYTDTSTTTEIYSQYHAPAFDPSHYYSGSGLQKDASAVNFKVKNGLRIVFTIVSETVMQGTFWGDYYDEGNPFGNNKPIHISNGSFYLKVQK
jgi:hypothetical protein